jgi:hypothetical protein
MAEGGAAPVFISYASQDAAVAPALVEALDRHGIACWIAPRYVKVGRCSLLPDIDFRKQPVVKASNGSKTGLQSIRRQAATLRHSCRQDRRQ